MDSKFYVSLEAARLLKEKGYNNYSTVYDCSVKGSILLNQHPIYGEWVEDKDVYPCPTKAEAIDWLESKGILIATSFTYSRQWFCTIESLRDEMVSTLISPTRLEAEGAAIVKALTLL